MAPKIKKIKSGVRVRIEKTTLITGKENNSNNNIEPDNNNNNNKDDFNLHIIKQEDTNIKEDKKVENVNNQIWLVGDLVWSKIPGHCWWPSMVSYDPCDAIYFTKSKNGRDAVKYHVQFFGDKSLRGWVSKGNMIRFQGKVHFLSLPTKLLKNKNPSSKQKGSWENAIKQADNALLVTRNERKLKFMVTYDNAPPVKYKDTKKNMTAIIQKKKSTGPEMNELGAVETDMLRVLPPGADVKKMSENSSDSGIEDLGSENLSEEMNEDISPNSTKRKRKQKEFTDYHTGMVMNLAIKSTRWKEVPEKKLKLGDLKASEGKTSPLKIEERRKSFKPKFQLRGKEYQPTIKEEDLSFTNNGIPSEEQKTVKNENRKKKLSKQKQRGQQVVESIIENPKQIDEKLKVKKDENNYCCLCEELSINLISCSGPCARSFHFDCLGLGCRPKGNFTCDECLTGHHQCFLCKLSGVTIKCSQVSCGKFYHQECINDIMSKDDTPKPNQNGLQTRFFCPLHSCKVCVETSKSSNSSNPVTLPNSKIVKCIRCPTAYHQKTCFIAGCQVLSSQFMICDQHYEEEAKKKKKKNHVNVTWCFVCSHGGSLVCCDTCPASFHPECLDGLQGIPDGAWRCKNCLEHKKPKYGEIVWVKFGVYRWWPGRICFPEEIPERIQNLPHTLGEFPLMFFGSHDYCWLHSGRVFKYEEGDKGSKLTKSNSLGKYFRQALLEAEEAYNLYKKEQEIISETLDKKKSRKPPPYKWIKVNRPVSCVRTILDQSEWPICECSETEGCTAESECLNRMLYFECSSKTCKAGVACKNQRMQKCQYKKSKPFKSEGRGWGLKADEEIKSGEFVLEYVGELIDETTCQKRVKEYHENDISDYYFLTIDRDNIIDAFPKGNLSRFMNHSCNPNCETQKWTVNGEVRVGLFATRDISNGEELSFNYHLDCMGNEKKKCKCGAENCSGFLGVKPKTQNAMLSTAEKAQKKKQKEKERRKQKRMKKQKVVKKVHEDECYHCKDGGDLILCSRVTCTKSYHLKCLSLDKKPYGKWECPWHFCDACGKTAKFMCSLCANSYCVKHQEGELFPLRDSTMVCSDHSEQEFTSFLAALETKLKVDDVSIVQANGDVKTESLDEVTTDRTDDVIKKLNVKEEVTTRKTIKRKIKQEEITVQKRRKKTVVKKTKK